MELEKQTKIEAAVFRRFLKHLDEHKEVQNIDLIIFGYCGIRILGMLPLKLFRLEILPVYKQPGYVEKYSKKIADTIEQIHQLDVLADKNKDGGLEKLFPRKRTKMVIQMEQKMARDLEGYLKRRRAKTKS